MITNATIQGAAIQYAKSRTDITDALDAAGSSAEEIREDQWQGDEFIYPNIRLRVIRLDPADKQCDKARVLLSWEVYSEQKSSLQSDTIAGIIHNDLHERAFISNNISFNLITERIIPAQRKDSLTWRSEVIMSGTVSDLS